MTAHLQTGRIGEGLTGNTAAGAKGIPHKRQQLLLREAQ
jgi:hypothetical protein